MPTPYTRPFSRLVSLYKRVIPSNMHVLEKDFRLQRRLGVEPARRTAVRGTWLRERGGPPSTGVLRARRTGVDAGRRAVDRSVDRGRPGVLGTKPGAKGDLRAGVLGTARCAKGAGGAGGSGRCPSVSRALPGELGETGTRHSREGERGAVGLSSRADPGLFGLSRRCDPSGLARCLADPGVFGLVGRK